MPETLIHYSKEPLLKVESVPIKAHRPSHKPSGLWVSVEGPDDWKTWCQAENFNLDRLALAHRIELSDHAQILRIVDSAGIDRLTREYALRHFPGSEFFAAGEFTYAMDWKRLARLWNGIIIAPYIWERRLEGGSDWYYAWDCASGCIWNASAVKNIVPIPKRDRVTV
jgi:hypothetical protein